jgi:hypothetical protein
MLLDAAPGCVTLLPEGGRWVRFHRQPLLQTNYLPSQIAVLSLIGPVAFIVLAWALLGDTPSPLIWAGTVLVTVATLRERRTC